jgi:DNA-directed RNA polymerase subunit RPC12/RpoP
MGETGNLKTLCGRCGAEFEFPATAAGRAITCPSCREKIVLKILARPPLGRTFMFSLPSSRLRFLALGIVLLAAALAVWFFLPDRKGPVEAAPVAALPSPGAPAPAVPGNTPAVAPAPAMPAEISGRIRLVRADGSVVKFPATDVVLLDAAEGRARHAECLAAARSNSAWLVSMKAGCDAQAETNSAQLRALEEKLDTLKRLTDLTEEGIRLTRTNIQALGLSEAAPQRDPKGDIAQLNLLLAKQKRNGALQEQLQVKMKGFEQKIAALVAQTRTLLEEQQRWHSPRPFFARPWTNVIAQATTDADGGFILELPGAGDYWIAAFIPRPEGTAGKDYGWLLPLTPDADGNVELSNNNAIYLP